MDDQLLSQLETPSRPTLLKRGLNYSHDGMIDMILANPGISQDALAARIGYSASWVSTIMCSDAFQARLAERAAEIVDPALRATVQDNLKGVLARSLEIIQQKLSAPAASVPDNFALRTMEISSRALGYGARPETPQVQINIGAHLDELGGRLVNLLDRKKQEALPQIPPGLLDEQLA